MSSFDLRLLYLLNNLIGKSDSLDFILRFLALFGPLWSVWELSQPWLRQQDGNKCVRITRNALLSGGAAYLLATITAHLAVRARPFLSFPVVLLYFPPNNNSFPDVVTALGVGLTLGAVHYQRSRWGVAGGMTALWVLARMASGTMFPLDALAGVVLGVLPVSLELLVARVPLPSWAVRLGSIGVGVGLASLALALHNHRPALPTQSPTQERMEELHPNGPIAPVPDVRMKGFLPEEEASILSITDTLPLPPPVERVEVGQGFIKVAGVKLRAGDHWDFRSRKTTEWQAARTLKALLLKDPGLAEIDLWAVVPFHAKPGKEALRPVLFVQARRTRGKRLMLATPKQLLLHAPELLNSVGEVYELQKEFPQPGVTLPNGVAEGAG